VFLQRLRAVVRDIAAAVSLHRNGGRGCRVGRGRNGDILRHRARPAARRRARRPILIKGGCALTLDRALGDFEAADVLIEGKMISIRRPIPMLP